MTQALARLSPDDRKIAEKQQFCPILSDNKLGTMGVPVKVMLENQPVFLCCAGCKKQAQENPNETLAKVQKLKEGALPSATPASASAPDRDTVQRKDPDVKIQAALAKLSDEDRSLATEQRFCVVLPKSRLGSMGTPIKLTVAGQPVFICCEGCREQALADPDATLKKVAGLKVSQSGGK
jgi:hypothetical protein